ncbi:YfiR family protein [Sulfuricurvum sp.]|uniref:YfiR family protein n=1 Tax=Sulfuricurvum sp. TaxID=2025608 RepID=UPI002E2F9B46|nr:YfiR family protein [Sulfuricurvum sp.]HEX5329621.1 YfiR family protein [Sulfuricurvum sp.]
MKTTKLLAAVFFLFFCIASVFAISEESVKAAYLERFTMFIKWPKPIDSYTICIYNDDLFAQTLQKNYSSHLFNNHPLKVISLHEGDSTEEMFKCHILYFRGSKPHQNEALLGALRKNNVLIISDDDDDAKRGAMIGFYLQNNAFKFVINQRNLENANLNASYKLLNFATVIEPTGGAK